MKTYVNYKRNQLNLSKSELARQVGIPYATYYRIEVSKDLKIYSYRKLNSLAQVFGLTVEELIKNDEEFKENGDNYDTN